MRIALLLVLAACNQYWPCPDWQPANHQPCTLRPDNAGDYCEYGGDDHGQCRTTADCAEAPGSTTQAIWYVNKPDATCGKNASSCPAAFGVMEGSSCATTADDCTYAQGKCGCIGCTNADGTAGGTWHCRPWSDVGAGCPEARPRPGETCDEDGVFCNYNDCCYGPSFGGDMKCKGGVWQTTVNPACICVTPKCS